MSSPSPEAAQGPSYTFRLSDLPKLDLQVDRGTDFTAWLLQWQSYCNLSELAGQEASKQVEALSLCFSRETLSIVQNLGLTTEQRNNVMQIIEALQRYVDGHLNETVERRNFRHRLQQPGETFDDFLIALHANNVKQAIAPGTQSQPVESQSVTQALMTQYPTVFDGQIRIMEGEKFHITLIDDAVPFCVKTPQAIPFAYRDKLKVELDLLQEQGIITPVTVVCPYCSNPQKRVRQNTHVCRPFPSKPLCQKREIPVSNSCRSSCRHFNKRGKVLHCDRCSKGVPSMSTGRGEPAVHHFYHPIWALQVSESPIRPIIHCRAL